MPDHEGDDLPDLQAAHKLALETIQDMMRLPHVYGEMREWQKDEFVITDEAGAVMLVVPFSGADGED